MNDPKRWLEDEGVSANVRQLLEAGDPPPTVPPATHTHLAALTHGLVAKSTLSAVTGSVLGGKAVLLGSTVIGLAATAGIASMTVLAPERTPATVALAPSAPAMVSSLAPAKATLAPRHSAAPEQRPASVPAPAPVAQSRDDGRSAVSIATAPSASVATFGDASMAAEAKLLERARAALPTTPASALQLADEHARLYRGGQLAAEREVIAVDALHRLGRDAEARRRAAPLLAAPSNVYSRRVAQILGDAP